MENKKVASSAAKEEERLQRITHKNDLIFIGVVTDIGPAPQNWAGYNSSYQFVRYPIEKAIKGEHSSTEISVEHVVVFGSKTAQQAETPGLSKKIFYPGAKLIVSAQKVSFDQWKSLNEVIGAVPFSPDWLKRVEAFVPIAN